jgi:pimeloyl-ACP methyl ester carboxylesterase
MIYNPGWQKGPTISTVMLEEASRPDGLNKAVVGFDNRRGKYEIGDIQKIFGPDVDPDDIHRLRRPTALGVGILALKEMGYDLSRSVVVGHSEGGRIISTLLDENTIGINTKKLILVNPVGAGDFRGLRGLAGTVADAAKRVISKKSRTAYEGDLHEDVINGSIASFLESSFCAPRFYPQFWHEKEAIRRERSTLDRMSRIADKGTEVHLVLNEDDRVINPKRAIAECPPNVNLHVVPGGHDALYYQQTMRLILDLAS